MLAWSLIGCLVFLVMGLTGAGGGMVSLSLFLIFFEFSIQKSTVLSLLVISFAAGLNWILHMRQAAYSMGLCLAFFSVFGSYAGVWLKLRLPPEIQKGIILVILGWSIYSFWVKESNPYKSQSFPIVSKFKTMVSGLILGVFATITGFSGGIILMPLFLSLGFDISAALATTHFTTCMASLGSLLVQADVWADYRNLSLYGHLTLGMFLGTLVLVTTKRLLHPMYYSRLRRIVFTIVVLMAGISIMKNG